MNSYTNHIDEKLKAFANKVVPYPEHKQALETIMRCVETTRQRGEPSSALITGESGTGKSTVSKLAVSLFGEPTIVTTESGSVQTYPAIFHALLGVPTLKSLSSDLLNKLGATDLTGDTSALFNRLVRLLKTSQTKLIVLDEFDKILDKGAVKSQVITCNWLRSLMNETLIPVVIVGVPKCEEIIKANPQTGRRYPYRAEMHLFDYAAVSPKSVLSQTLRSLGNDIKEIGGFDDCVSLSGDHALTAMYLATGGNLNGIRLILNDSFRTALNRNDGSFKLEDMADAFDTLTVDTVIKTHGNPFRMKIDALKKVVSRGNNH
jgi:hypothetical protein